MYDTGGCGAGGEEIYTGAVITGSASLVSGYFAPGISLNENGIVRISGVTGTINLPGYFTWIK